MKRPVILRPEALADLAEARDWYEEKQTGLGLRLLDAFDDALERITNAPEAYELAVGQTRRIRLRRFPYVVYFRELPEGIEVLAVLHGRQSQQHWQRRV